MRLPNNENCECSDCDAAHLLNFEHTETYNNIPCLYTCSAMQVIGREKRRCTVVEWLVVVVVVAWCPVLSLTSSFEARTAFGPRLASSV